MLKIAADKQLRLPRRDIERGILCLNRVRNFLYVCFETRDRFSNGRQQPCSIDLWIAQGPDQAILNRPPMQARKQGHLRWVPEIFLPELDFPCRFLHLLRVRIRQLFQDREMPDRFIKLKILS